MATGAEFFKSFDELLEQILTDYRNQFPEADTSQGSMIFIKSACLASAMWGLHQYQDWISRQIFPDMAVTENLEHHAWIWGINRTYEESDSALLARVLDRIRRPPAGGNQYDYVKWAMEIDNVAAAYCIPLAQGLGTVDVVIAADKVATGSEEPSDYTDIEGASTSVDEGCLVDSGRDFDDVMPGDVVTNDTTGEYTTVTDDDDNSTTRLALTDDIFTAIGQNYTIQSLAVRVKAYIDDERPVTASVVQVLGIALVTQAITMTVTGSDADLIGIESDIAAYLNAFIPGQTLYKTQLSAIAINNGADNATVSVPAADVTTTEYQAIRPGAIGVT